MDLKGILSISGYSGLFKLVTHTRNGIVVEHLETQNRMQAFATSKISALEDIAIFTEGEDIHLKEVFKNAFIYSQGKEITDLRSNADYKTIFTKVLPEYDKERVYVSDMKRVFSWYNLLLKHNIINAEAIEAMNNSVEETVESQEENQVEQN